MKRLKTRQLSFRAELELFEKVEAAAQFEDLSTADFVRKIFRRAYREYEAAGSLHVLRSQDSVADPEQKETKKRKAG